MHSPTACALGSADMLTEAIEGEMFMAPRASHLIGVHHGGCWKDGNVVAKLHAIKHFSSGAQILI
jgi:hypothetical protein